MIIAILVLWIWTLSGTGDIPDFAKDRKFLIYRSFLPLFGSIFGFLMVVATCLAGIFAIDPVKSKINKSNLISHIPHIRADIFLEFSCVNLLI